MFASQVSSNANILSLNSRYKDHHSFGKIERSKLGNFSRILNKKKVAAKWSIEYDARSDYDDNFLLFLNLIPIPGKSGKCKKIPQTD